MSNKEKNPYEAPTSKATADSSRDREYLVRVATAHKHAVYAVLAYVVVYLVCFVIGRTMPGLLNIGLFVLFAVMLSGGVATYRLASLFRSKVVAAIYFFCLLIPCLGLLLLLLISQEATKILQANNIKVGFLGANPDEI